MKNIIQVFINSVDSLDLFRNALKNADFVAIMHHEPPISLPFAAHLDLITIRTMNHVFHILPVSNPASSQSAISILRSYARDGFIYGRSPQGLCRILQDLYAWEPNVYDVTPYIEQQAGVRESTVRDLVSFLFDCDRGPCPQGRVFSCHARPSRTAIRHREFLVSVIYSLAVRKIGAHKKNVERRAAAAQAAAEAKKEDERAQREEERLRIEEVERRRQEEREERRLQQERSDKEAEEMQAEAEALARRQRKHEEERRRLAVREERDRSPRDCRGRSGSYHSVERESTSRRHR